VAPQSVRAELAARRTRQAPPPAPPAAPLAGPRAAAARQAPPAVPRERRDSGRRPLGQPRGPASRGVCRGAGGGVCSRERCLASPGPWGLPGYTCFRLVDGGRVVKSVLLNTPLFFFFELRTNFFFEFMLLFLLNFFSFSFFGVLRRLLFTTKPRFRSPRSSGR